MEEIKAYKMFAGKPDEKGRLDRPILLIIIIIIIIIIIKRMLKKWNG
jgi:hypothetical protein